MVEGILVIKALYHVSPTRLSCSLFWKDLTEVLCFDVGLCVKTHAWIWSVGWVSKDASLGLRANPTAGSWSRLSIDLCFFYWQMLDYFVNQTVSSINEMDFVGRFLICSKDDLRMNLTFSLEDVEVDFVYCNFNSIIITFFFWVYIVWIYCIFFRIFFFFFLCI